MLSNPRDSIPGESWLTGIAEGRAETIYDMLDNPESWECSPGPQTQVCLQENHLNEHSQT